MPKGPVRVVIDVAKNKQGEWHVRLNFPAASRDSIEMDDVVLEGNTLSFKGTSMKDQPNFKFTIVGNEKMSGTVFSVNGSLPLELKRTGVPARK